MPHATPDAPREKFIRVSWWATLLGLLVLVWLTPAIPSQDGPSHLYNLIALKDLLRADPHWTQYHQLANRLATNFGFLAFALPLSYAMPPWAIERATIAIHLILINGFALCWLRATGRRCFPAAWIAFAFALPWPLFMGFYGFQLSCDLAMLGICGAWRLRDRGGVISGALVWPVGVVLSLLHPGGAGLFAGLVALIELTRLETPPWRRWGHALLLSLPILVFVLTLFLLDSTAAFEKHAFRWQTITWQPASYVAFFLVTLGNVSFAGQGGVFVAITGGFVWLCCLPGRARKDSHFDHASRFAISAALALSLLHILLPNTGIGGGFLTGRYVGWIPLVLLPLVNSPMNPTESPLRHAAPIAIGLLYLASLSIAVAPITRDLAQIRSAAEHHSTRSRVAEVFFDRQPSTRAMIEPLLHIDSYFAMPRGLLVTNYEATARFFPVRRTDAARRDFAAVDHAADRNIDWSSQPIDTWVTIDATPEDKSKIRDSFFLLWSGRHGRVEVWRRRSDTGVDTGVKAAPQSLPSQDRNP